ncbi:MAG: hypothetical protein CMN75_11710 [Spirochaeta sp.]|nr:hypothetical protein [Spirochaeta sp.]RPG11959.1 MAG: DUF1501 domain-containing protein [Proteobacteria bacterium TMED72]
MDKSRRNFLRKAGIGLVGAGLGMGVPGVGQAIQGSFNPGFSINPEDLAPRPWDLAPNFCSGGKRVLEIVLYGGLSPWETFWVGSGGGDWFRDDDTLNFVNVDMRGAASQVSGFDWCDTGPVANRVKYFADDEAGNSVYWGPATQPLWDSDIMDSTRMITFGHDKNVHELAMPLALTGLSFGNPRAAGLGAAISKAYRENPACDNDDRPYSYALFPSDIGGFRTIVSSILATGSHGGVNRPVELTVGPDGLGDLFLDAEPNAQVREALQMLRQQYEKRLRWQGDPNQAVRSPQFNDYEASALTLENASSLHELLGGNTLVAGPGESCEEEPVSTSWNRTARSLEVAADLLDPSQGNARYVGVFDAGFPDYKYGGAPYDTHPGAGTNQHIPFTMGNLYNCLSSLRQLIDSGAINLNSTMVVLTTEMGRTPSLIGSQQGRDHWTEATVQVLLGCDGPRGIVGAINPDNSRAYAPVEDSADPFKAAHARAAVLKAAGVNPVTHNTFSLGDLQGPLSAATDPAMSELIGSRILGV